MNQNGTSIIEMMVALVVMGIVISGTYEGFEAIGATNVASEKSFSAQQAVAEAALILENLPADALNLKDDGDQTDLDNVVSPDHQKDPLLGTATWTINANDIPIRIIYNVSAGSVGSNISTIKIFAIWDDQGTATSRDHNHRIERLILRGGMP